MNSTVFRVRSSEVTFCYDCNSLKSKGSGLFFVVVVVFLFFVVVVVVVVVVWGGS